MSVVSSASSVSSRSNSDSDEEVSRRRRRKKPEPEKEPGLFVNPTIARDEAQGESSKWQERLTDFGTRVTGGPPLQQRNGDSQLAPPGQHPPGARAPSPPPRWYPRPPPPLSTITVDDEIIQRRQPPFVRRHGIPRHRRIRSPSPSDPASYPTAKISTESSWRRKATRKKRGVPEGHSSGDNTTRRRRNLQNKGAPEVTLQSQVSSEKNNGNPAQSPTGLTAVQGSQIEIKSDQIDEQNSPTKEQSPQLASTSPSLISDGDQSSSSKVAISISGEKPGLDGEDATIAETLHAVADKVLHLDVLDQKDEARRFIGYLLDTIERLQAMTRYNQATDEESSDSSSDTEDEEKPVTPRGQTLHRVYCQNEDHNHGSLLFEDDPVYKGKSRMLTGQVAVPNLNFFLGRHPDVCFVIMKEYNCAGTQRRRARNSVHRDTRDGLSERSETIQIVSPRLQKALLNVAEYHPFPGGRPPGMMYQMDAPYHFLFHHWNTLEKTSQDTNYEDVLKPLLEWLEKNYGKEYNEADRLFAEGFVTTRHMSKLFKPNQMVVHRGDFGHVTAYVLSENALYKKEKLSFHGWSWKYDGHRLQRRAWSESMSIFSEGKCRISDLMIHPINHATPKDRATLERIGRKYWAMREQTYTCYSGWNVNQEHHYNNARFMVDTATYHLMHPMVGAYDKIGHDAGVPAANSALSLDHARFDTRPASISKHEEISPEDFMLLPTTVLGFNFHAKKWTRLAVANTHDVDWNKKAFDRLVLDQKLKDMIYALVDVQISAGKMEDIITGKGNGLIILLHGSPGTGKTLTAESVAEISEKPLYRVTCGDIGTKAEEVEQYLETVMYLGKIWNCVLLLDEADVFLEERTMADLQRNSLVSVFLRTLEYYEGILILTSNRVGTFDEAFKSRIQVAIHYNNLTKTSRKAIWQNFFDMIEESPDEDANLGELERRLDELARQDMNGRQIRNALLTARQLAKHKQERLDWSHLSQVIKTSAEFHRYLVTVKGHSDEQWAREEALR